MNIYRDNMIAYWQAGSKLWGTETPESDDDFIGIFIEPSCYILGTAERIPAVYSESTAQVSEDGSTRAKSAKGDTETKWYSAREFLIRCVKGDPNLVPLLWASAMTQTGPSGYLIDEITRLLSQQVVAHHVMQVNERQKSIEKRMRHDETDVPVWKDAMHMVRVAMQAYDLALDGKIVPWHRARELVEIRSGKWRWPAVVEVAKDYIGRAAVVNPALPKDETIDLTRANGVLEDVYTHWWKNH